MFPLRTALLRKWLERNGHVATYSELVKGMYSAGQINTIDELVNVLRNNPLSDPAAGPHQIGELNRLGYVYRHSLLCDFRDIFECTTRPINQPTAN